MDALAARDGGNHLDAFQLRDDVIVGYMDRVRSFLTITDA
jgi:hypothetical protein